MPDHSFYEYCTRGDLVYESTLVGREVLLKRFVTVNRPFASFPNLRAGMDNTGGKSEY